MARNRKLYLEMAPYGVWYFIEEVDGVRSVMYGPCDTFDALMKGVTLLRHPTLTDNPHLRILLEEKIDAV